MITDKGNRTVTFELAKIDGVKPFKYSDPIRRRVFIGSSCVYIVDKDDSTGKLCRQTRKPLNVRWLAKQLEWCCKNK